MTVQKLLGSGGNVTADITDEQAAAADLGVGKMFLAPVGKINPEKMLKYFCKNCSEGFDGPPEIRAESTGEEVSDNMSLVERGQYACQKCASTIGEYRVFKMHDGHGDAGMARQGV